MKKRFYNVLLAGCVAVFVVCIGKAGVSIHSYIKQDAEYSEIQNMIPSTRAELADGITIDVPEEEKPEQKQEGSLFEEPIPEETPEVWVENHEVRLPGYEKLHNQNPDVIGWIHVNGTKIDYPVCWVPEDPEFYLFRNIRKEHSSFGTPFVNHGCDLNDPFRNIVICGHHMKNGAMFAGLDKYKSSSFRNSNPYLYFDTLESSRVYEVADVVRLEDGGADKAWSKVLFPASEEEFQSALAALDTKRYYNCGVPLSFGDELLGLVTCEYSRRDGRLLVIGKKVEETIHE